MCANICLNHTHIYAQVNKSAKPLAHSLLSKLTTCGATINRASRGHLWFRSCVCNGGLSSVTKAILSHKFHFHYLFIYMCEYVVLRWSTYFWFCYCCCLPLVFRFLWHWIGSHCPRIVCRHNCAVSAAARHIFSVINCQIVAALHTG